MKKFKELILDSTYNRSLDFPSVSATLGEHTLAIRFDSKDIVLNAGYTGKANPWFSSLCYLIEGKSLTEIYKFSWKEWKSAFKEDQDFWEFFEGEEEKFFNFPLELLKVCLDIFRGREYLYEEASPLVCRCFGIRESDILEHLQMNENPTLETLAGVSKAGMGCRSCMPQLKRWFSPDDSKKIRHYYKDRPAADWILEIEEALARFPKGPEWKLEVQGLRGHQVSISFDRKASQQEEESIGKELQDFLGDAVDPGLAFFLRRARHLSKASR